MLLTEKRALITGASRGIGRAIALAFAREGADILLHYYQSAENPEINEKSQALEVADEIKKMGREAVLIGFDLADREMTENCLKDISKDYPVDIVVNNAGITADNLIMRMKSEQWQKVLDVNLTGSFTVTKTLTRSLLKRQGNVIFIASVIGQMGNPGQANYAASKAGVIGMCKSFAKELGSKKVRANVIAPGFIETQMTEVMSQEARDTLMRNVALGEAGTPEDIANAALFLASPMSRYITGEVLKVNGGMYM